MPRPNDLDHAALLMALDECARLLESGDSQPSKAHVIAAIERGRAALRAPSTKPHLQWPAARDVGRIGDMGKGAHLRVGLDSDNDVYVSVWDDEAGASVEFCTGMGGGGLSPKTREALIGLMVAIEQDNKDCPRRDWWIQRTGAPDAT